MTHSLRTLTGCAGVGLTIVLCLTDVLPADAGQKPDSGLYTLRYKFKAGDICEYQTSGSLAIQLPGMGEAGGGKAASKPAGQGTPMTLPINASQKVKVLKALPNGSGEVEMTVISAGGAADGSAQTPRIASYTLSPTGIISGMKGNLSGAGGNNLIAAFAGNIVAGSVTAYLPEKPVKIGDTWTRKVDVAQAGTTGTVTGKLVSIGQISHYKTAHIKLVLTVPVNTSQKIGGGSKATTAQGTPQGMNINGKVVMTFDDDFAIAEGKLIKSAGTGTVNITTQQKTSGDKSGTPAPPAKPISMNITLSSSLTQ